MGFSFYAVFGFLTLAVALPERQSGMDDASELQVPDTQIIFAHGGLSNDTHIDNFWDSRRTDKDSNDDCSSTIFIIPDPRPLSEFALDGVIKSAVASVPNTRSGEHKKNTYLQLVRGVVSFFRSHQNKEKGTPRFGKIIDPYEQVEIQYSTPCFAHAGAVLLSTMEDKQSGEYVSMRSDVVDALRAALTSLMKGSDRTEGCATLNSDLYHCNFYTTHVMLAMKTMKGILEDQEYAELTQIAAQVDEHKVYFEYPEGKGGGTTGNWLVLAAAGEYLRFKEGLRNGSDAHDVETVMWTQSSEITANGQYEDNTGCSTDSGRLGECSPVAYDSFTRIYMEQLVDAGYAGWGAENLEENTRRGAWTSMLLQSARGELATGGRSGQHVWNEAMNIPIFERQATLLQAKGNENHAKIFRRAAQLAVQSINRQVRPSGEFNIVKNRYNPESRYGYETYSYHSQYNLLAAAWLAHAYTIADDSIQAGTALPESGIYVFEPEKFHKVIANVHGTFVEVELKPDPGVDGLGLTRFHDPSTEPLITVTAAAPFLENTDGNGQGIGLVWRKGDIVKRMADHTFKAVRQTSWWQTSRTDSQIQFEVNYKFEVMEVREKYEVSKGKVKLTTGVKASSGISAIGISFPIFITDGSRFTEHHVTNDGERGTGEVVVSMGGDQRSGLGKTCSSFRVSSAPPSACSGDWVWTVHDSVHRKSRNGEMLSVDVMCTLRSGEALDNFESSHTTVEIVAQGSC